MPNTFFIIYAVGWGIILMLGGKYHCFEPHLILGKDAGARGRALNRFLLGVGALVLAPAGWLLLTVAWLAARKGGGDALGTLGVVVAAFSIHGWVRILHACCATERLYPEFYTEEEWHRVPGVERALAAGANTFSAHLWSGVAMVVVPTVVAKLLLL